MKIEPLEIPKLPTELPFGEMCAYYWQHFKHCFKIAVECSIVFAIIHSILLSISSPGGCYSPVGMAAQIVIAVVFVLALVAITLQGRLWRPLHHFARRLFVRALGPETAMVVAVTVLLTFFWTGITIATRITMASSSSGDAPTPAADPNVPEWHPIKKDAPAPSPAPSVGAVPPKKGVRVTDGSSG